MRSVERFGLFGLLPGHSAAATGYARNVVTASGNFAVRTPAHSRCRRASRASSADRYRSADALPFRDDAGRRRRRERPAARGRPPCRNGREVVLAVGRHSRAPRRYRGRDIFAWLHLLGDLDKTIDEVRDPEAARRVPYFPLSGANGGVATRPERTARPRRRHGRAARSFQNGAWRTSAMGSPPTSRRPTTAYGKLLARIDAHPAAAGTERELIAPCGAAGATALARPACRRRRLVGERLPPLLPMAACPGRPRRDGANRPAAWE